MYLIVTFITGSLLGRLAAGWSAHMLREMNSGGLIACQSCRASVPAFERWFTLKSIRCTCGGASIRWHLASTFGLGVLFCMFSLFLIEFQCESVHEVRPSSSLLYARLPFHLLLIFLLWVATVTDLLDYVIPDEVVFLGIVIGVIAATISGELQMIHVWVNWDDAIDGVRGPYLPDWMKTSQHLHGLAWSVAGLLCGVTLTWLVRRSSHLILGYPALGLGDVTLMAMIGAFLGWQPVLCILAVAPLTGIAIGLLVRICTGRSFVAYGPYLAISAVLVMMFWRWLWADYFTLRDIFSHWPSVAGLVGFSFAALVVLLFLLRLFRQLPAESLRQ